MFIYAAALFSVAWCAIADAEELPPALTFGITVTISSGLRGQVYNIAHNNEALPDFTKLKSAGTIYTTALNVPPQDFRQGFPGITKRFEWFAIDYTGLFWIEDAGPYSFRLTSDDGAKLYIDNQAVIDNDGRHPPEDRIGGMNLDAGVHRIRISYFQGPRFQVALVLQVARPGEAFRVFSTDEFKPPARVEEWSP